METGRRRAVLYVAAIDALVPREDFVVVLVRAWFDGQQLRARVMFSPRSRGVDEIVVGSMDDICRVIATEIESKRPPAS